MSGQPLRYSPAVELWILDPAPIMGGGQAFALKLARAAESARIVCPADSELAVRAVECDVTVTPAEMPDLTPAGIWRGRRAVRRLLATAGDDVVVVANHPRAHAFAWAARRPRVPAVLVAHDQESAARRSARFVYRRFGALVTVGANAAATYERALPGVEVRRINNFLLDVPADAAPRAGHERPVLGVLARMIPEKGIRELVAELATQRDAWGLLHVGAAPEDPAYVAEVQRGLEDARLRSRVELLGHVADVPGFLAGIDVLVVPSVGPEVQPTVILEALAHGRPVVVRAPLWSPDFEGLPVLPYEDPGDLAAAIERAAALPVPPWSELEGRFGPRQAVDGIVAAAQAASARS
jgi:glycosyltransferase involved in cell wall biosynthesis